MAALINAFQFPVAIDRSLGQLKQQRDYATYVGQLVKQLLLTTPGERAHRPDFGAGLLGMVFAPNDDSTASLLQTTILQALNTWLGTILSVNDVLVQANGSTLNVTVTYTVLARGNQEVLNLEVTI
ncbi:MAG TPA: GPW/gp25 family protein [Polyangia bacterium]|nr:GPW/gp25 family protein [Polyangia bacterium]